MYFFVNIDCARCKDQRQPVPSRSARAIMTNLARMLWIHGCRGSTTLDESPSSSSVAKRATVNGRLRAHSEITPSRVSEIVRRGLEVPKVSATTLVWATSRQDGGHGIHLYVPVAIAHEIIPLVLEDVNDSESACVVDPNDISRLDRVSEFNPEYRMPFIVSRDSLIDRELRLLFVTTYVRGKSVPSPLVVLENLEPMLEIVLSREMDEKSRRPERWSAATVARALRIMNESGVNPVGKGEPLHSVAKALLLNDDNDLASLFTSLLLSQ